MNKKNIFQRLRSFTNNLEEIPTKPDIPNFQHTYVHPCVINNQPYIIYPRGLKELEPALYEQLHLYYSQKGYRLKEDQRSNKNNQQYKNERRRWVPILIFTASLFFESAANADVEIEIKDNGKLQKQQIDLHLISNHEVRKKIQTQLEMDISNSEVVKTNIKNTKASELFQILKVRYIKKNSDPDFIIDDLKQLANYYSQFPEVVKLLYNLKDKNWELSYDENNWITTASGNMMEVEKAVIKFNTRSAAQLRLNKACKQNPICIASPADALLHELLHTHSMLKNTEEFLSQGGMNNVIYPYKHEYSVIDAERHLYASMSKRDTIKRPQRREHSGRLVKANCPTCIK